MCMFFRKAKNIFFMFVEQETKVRLTYAKDVINGG